MSVRNENNGQKADSQTRASSQGGASTTADPDDDETKALQEEYDDLKKQCTELQAVLDKLKNAPEAVAEEMLRQMRSSKSI